MFDATATAAVDRPVRVTIVGSEGVLEVVSENVHEIGGRILLHTADGTSELFYRPSWGDSTTHDNSAMAPFGKLVCDAVDIRRWARLCSRDGPSHAEPLKGALFAPSIRM